MKLTEQVLDQNDMVKFTWEQEDGRKVWIEITVDDEGLSLYCDGEGGAGLIAKNSNAVNVMNIVPDLWSHT